MVCDHETYFLCANVVNELILKHDSKILGVIVIEINVQVRSRKSSIIHYIFVLPKLIHRDYGTYLLGNVFSSDPGIENRKLYAVAKLINNYIPSAYVEPVSQYLVDDLTDQIRQDKIADDNNAFPRCLIYSK